MQYQEIDAFNRSEFQMFMEDLLSHGISILGRLSTCVMLIIWDIDIDADENMELEADAIGFTFSGPIVEESKGDSNAASAIDTEAEEKRQRIWAQYQSEIARQKQKVEINSGGSWTERSAIERYQALSKEFTQTRYGPETPLTLYSIPWPSLIYPNNMGLEDITWENTESFFARMRRLTYGNEYRKVLLNARQIFHPDRWRSRRLYDAIPDSDLRNAMEAVVTETSQAISALLPKE